MKFGCKEYPDDMKLSDFARQLEVEDGFRVTAQQFKSLLAGNEFSAQEVLDSC